MVSGLRRKAKRALALLAGLAALGIAPALAQAPPLGTFFASRACPALQSIAKGTNPGNIRIEPRQTYAVVTGNKDMPTHYLLIVPGASPQRRWVAIDCGTFTAANGVTTPPHTRPMPSAEQVNVPFKTDYVFAFAWQSAFCEEHDSVPECVGPAARVAAEQFSLHGLWPQPRSYCDVPPAQIAADQADRWWRLPAVGLSPGLRRALENAMPGTRSMLDRHEWIKHGTCSKMSVDSYFAVALALLGDVNNSAVRALFARSMGKPLTIEDVRAAADQSFGAGSGARLTMSCVTVRGRTLIDELTLGLTGRLDADPDLSRLILAAAPAKSTCTSGTVDPPGRQSAE